MKRAVTVWILNTAISLLFRIEARARKLRATAEACKTRRIGGELIEIPGGIGTRNGNLKIYPGRMEITGTLRGALQLPARQGELPSGFYGRGPVCPDRSKNFLAALPNPNPITFQRPNTKRQ